MEATPTSSRRIRSITLPSTSSPATLTSSFTSNKQQSQSSSQSNSKTVPTTFSLLPPPSQSHFQSRPSSSHSSSQTARSSQSSSSRSTTPRPTPRPPGIPRPPTSSRSRSQKSLPPSQSQSKPNHSTNLPSSTLHSLSSATQWSELDPHNTYLLNSSRLFQLSTIDLGEITNQQNKGKKPKYGPQSKKILNHFKREREPLEETRDQEGVPRWARDERGEVETQLIRRLGKRLAKLPTTTMSTVGGEKGIGEDFIPLIWASDLNPPSPSHSHSHSDSDSTSKERKGLRLVTSRNGEDLGALNDVWILGKEFPCKRVVVVGWVLEKEWRDREGGWVYTIDDGTALLQVVCPSSEPSMSFRSHRVSDPTSATSIVPQLSPPSLIPPVYLQTANLSSLPSQPLPRKKPKRPFSSLSEDQPPISSSASFEPETLIRVVGTITRPLYSNYSSTLRLTADRIEPISLNQEMKHHLLVSKLWDEVYRERVEVRDMLERIEREEREERELERVALTSSAGKSDSSFGSVSGCWSEASSSASSNSTTRYRPTRPSKLLAQDLTLDNFMIYIRHHILKTYITTTSSLPPPSSQSSNSYSFESDESIMKEEICSPFSLEDLKSHKHLSLFAKRMSLEWIERDRDKKLESKKKKARTSKGDLSLFLDSTNSQEEEDERKKRGRGVWVGEEREDVNKGAAILKRDRKKVEVGSSRLLPTTTRETRTSRLKMLPPPMSSSSAKSSSERDQRVKVREDLKRLEEEVGEGRLEKEMERCWEEAVRGLRKNGMIVEFIDQTRMIKDEDEEDDGHRYEEQLVKREEEEEDGIDEQQKRQLEKLLRTLGAESLPDEPSHGESIEEEREGENNKTPTTKRVGTKYKKKKVGESSSSKDDTPRASSKSTSSSSTNTSSSTPTPKYQLVTPISLVPLIISQIQELTRYRRSSESQNVTELEIRLAMYKDSRWTAVAEYGEVVTRALECAEKWGLIEGSGRGWRMA